MRFSIPQDILESALGKVIAASEGIAKLPPILRVEGDGKSVYLKTFNSHMAMQVKIDTVTAHEAFAIGVGAKHLYDIVKALSDESVIFCLTQSGCKVQTTTSAFRLKVVTPQSSPQTFSRMLDFEKYPYQPVEFEAFFGALDKVVYCTLEKDERQAYTRGVIITPQGFYGTDGFRLSAMPNKAIALQEGILIPIRAVKNLLKIYGDLGSRGGVYVDKGQMVFANGGVFCAVRLLADKIPPVSAVIPQGEHQRRILSKELFAKALKRSLILADGKLPVSTLKFSESTAAIHSESNGNASEETVDCSPWPKPFEVDVNTRSLLDAVSAVADDLVYVELRANADKVLALVVTDEKRVHINVVVPIRR